MTAKWHVGQVMEELIAKSKAFKAAKSQQQDEDLEATEALDTKLASLLESGSLAGLVKPKGARHDRKVAEKDAAPQHGDDTEFDKFRRELVFEAKGQVRPLMCRFFQAHHLPCLRLFLCHENLCLPMLVSGLAALLSLR